MFWAFASALVVSSAISAVVVLIRRMTSPQQQYDFTILSSNVLLIDEPAAGND